MSGADPAEEVQKIPKGQQRQRDVLTIPNIRAVGLTTDDAKDPETAFLPMCSRKANSPTKGDDGVQAHR